MSLKAVLRLFSGLVTAFFSQIQVVGKKSNSFGFCRSENRPRISILRLKLPFLLDLSVQLVGYSSIEDCDYLTVMGTG